MDIVFNFASKLLEFHWLLRLLIGAGLGGVLMVFGPNAVLFLKPSQETKQQSSSGAAVSGSSNSAIVGNNNQTFSGNQGTIFSGPVSINNSDTSPEKTTIELRLARALNFYINFSLIHSVSFYGRDAEVRLDSPPPWPLRLPVIETVDDDKELAAISEEIDKKFGWRINPELRKTYTEIAILSRHVKEDIANLHKDAGTPVWSNSKAMALIRLKRWRDTVRAEQGTLAMFCSYSGNEGYEDLQARTARTNLMSFPERARRADAR